MDITEFTVAAGAVTSVAAIIGGIGALLLRVHAGMTIFERMERAIFGSDSEAEPGVLARLRSVEEQLSPNGGKTTRDALDRIERKINEMSRGNS